METSGELNDLPGPSEWTYHLGRDGKHITFLDPTKDLTLTANYSAKI